MEERKGTYNEDGEYVMTDEEAMAEYKVLQPLLKKFNNDEIDAIFYVDEINEHLKKIMPYCKLNGIDVKLIDYSPDVRRRLERKAIIARDREKKNEAWLKMTKEERIKDYENIVEKATKFAEKMGMKIYEIKAKDENDGK